MRQNGIIFSLDSCLAFLFLIAFLLLSMSATAGMIGKEQKALKEFNEKQKVLFYADALAKNRQIEKNSEISTEIIGKNGLKFHAFDCKIKSFIAERIVSLQDEIAILRVGICE